MEAVVNSDVSFSYTDENDGQPTFLALIGTSDLPGMDDQCHMHIPGRGKLSELRDRHVLDGIAIQRAVVRPSQHELEVVDYHVLDIIHVHCMSHCLREREKGRREGGEGGR